VGFARGAFVVVGPQFFHFRGHGGFAGVVQARVGHLGGAEILAEEFNHASWREWVFEIQGAAKGFDRAADGGETLFRGRFGAP
jgi:hypothetical protein